MYDLGYFQGIVRNGFVIGGGSVLMMLKELGLKTMMWREIRKIVFCIRKIAKSGIADEIFDVEAIYTTETTIICF